MAWCSAQEILRQMLALWLSKHWRTGPGRQFGVWRMGKHWTKLNPPIISHHSGCGCCMLSLYYMLSCARQLVRVVSREILGCSRRQTLAWCAYVCMCPKMMAGTEVLQRKCNLLLIQFQLPDGPAHTSISFCCSIPLTACSPVAASYCGIC